MSRFGPLIPRRLMFIALALLGCAATLLIDARASPAAAQVDCADAVGGFEVSTAAELNAAIVCINTSPAVGPDGFPIPHQIDLLNDIEAPTLAGGAVFEPLVLYADLSIEGNGFSLSRSPDAPDDQLPLLSLQVEGEANLFDIGLQLSLDEASAIDFRGDELRLWAAAIEAPPGSAATGLVAAADATEVALRGSSIEGVAIGIVSDSFVSVVDSTIHSTGTDLLGPSDDFAVVDNSTLAGPVGIQMSNYTVMVQNSTILGDGAAPGGPNSFVEYRSSVVASCTATVLLAEDTPEPPDPPIPAIIDFGTNAGGCFDPTHVIDTELGDNGCQVPTPAGCPTTVALRSDSPALAVGDCTDNFSDQRDQPRTPVGSGCDAGSVEFDPVLAACIEADGSFMVATAEDLNAAIECYNATQPGSADFEVMLLGDIEADTVATTAVFTPISSETDSQFVVQGQGFTIRRGAAAPASSLPLLRLAPDRTAPFGLFDVGLELGPNDTAAVEGSGPVSVALIRSAITTTDDATTQATGFQLDGDLAELVAFDSLIDGMGVGIELRGESLDLYTTTVASSQVDLDLELPDPAAGPRATVENSTLGGPVGIRLADGWLEASNSTVVGDGAVSRDDPASSIISFRSSVVQSCSVPVFPPDAPPPSGPFVLAFPGNVGGCFDAGDVIDTELSDNGCSTTTPAGCPPTVRLSPDAAARGAADCTGFPPTDQRGLPRTPLAPGCDAGSFEAPDVECLANGSQAFTVANELELNDAIECFNDGTPGAGSYTITLARDITIEALGIGEMAVTSTIDQPSSSFDLTIDGAGHELRVDDPPVIGNGFAGNQIAISPNNAASISLLNISLESSSSEIDTLIRHEGSGALVVEQASLGRSSTAPTIIDSPDTGDVTILGSIVGSADGVVIEDGSLTVSDSTFVNRSGGTDLGITFGGTGVLVVTNSTFDGGSIFLDTDANATIHNSTFTGDALVLGSLINVTVSSSLINDCFAGPTDGGNNVGGADGCPTAAILLPAATDNGCLAPTPTGCAPTVAITLDSPAVGEGSCVGLATDQRGEPRTPTGQGCDAGSFEAPGFDPTADLGDVDNDGDTDNADVQALLDFLARGEIPAALNAGDLNEDGGIGVDDALALAQQVAGG